MIYRTIENSALFDARWYRQHAMAVHERFMDPLWHYLDIGWKKGANPSVFFDTNFYLLANPDVRDLGLNPLFHYLKYGVGEQRQPTQTGLNALYDMYGPASPLRLLPVPEGKSPRTTLVIDDFTPRDSQCPYARVLAVAVTIAASNDSRLRVLDRRTSPDYLPLADTIAHMSVSLKRGWEVSRIALSPRYHEIALQPDEIVVSSSFSSDRAISAVPASRRHYIVTDWEPRFHGDSLHGTQALDAMTTSDSNRTVLGSIESATVSDTQGATFAVRPGPRTSSVARITKRITIGVDGDVMASGQMVAHVIASLELALKKGVINSREHEVVVMGSLPRPINLLGSYVPEQRTCHTLSDIDAVAPGLDIFISLSRPSTLGVLEHAVVASGGQVISRATESLEGLHCVSSVDAPSVVEALGAAIGRVAARSTAPSSFTYEVEMAQ
jgi:hypothetical protein